MLCGKIESYNNKTNSNVNQLSIGYFSPKNKHCRQKRLINLCHPLKWGETRNAWRKSFVYKYGWFDIHYSMLHSRGFYFLMIGTSSISDSHPYIE